LIQKDQQLNSRRTQMKFNKLFLVGAMALAALSGCGNSKNDAAPVGSNAVETPAVEGGDQARGTPASTMDISDRKLMVDGVVVDGADENTFMGYPTLASRVSEAWLATRAVITTAGNLEIYQNDTLLFIINSPNSAASIAYSRNGFMADSIHWSLSSSDGDQGQGMRHGMLRFELSECAADQGQDQDKGEQDKGEQDKGEQDKGEQDKGEQDKGEQDQGQKAPEERVCKRATVELTFNEVITKEPDQGQKEPDQGQDKGEQDKGEQDKGEQDKGEQDTGEQDKGEQDKGEQDKGEQDKGEQDKGQQE